MFTPKRHGADKDAATWLPEITREQEFSVFDLADFHEICDDRGWLYAYCRQKAASGHSERGANK